ncbi:Pvc16 family protein [Streptomyces sp. NPDC053367]|uniref:Pvc16 family protein n=1 Tax=Streptomyces sp. NPDC053367 TaxID=3365700 RepID=UPI0037CD9AB8
MFHDLDATLRTLLADGQAPDRLREADVSFVTPDRDFKPAQDTVNLFLHDLQENRVLREQAPFLEEVEGDGIRSRRPPMRVDCTYLATAWSHKAGAVKAEDEHRLLGQLLFWFSRFPVIDERFLQGALSQPPRLFALPSSVGQSKDGAGTGQFWTALGVPPRPSLSFTVTIALGPFEEPELLPRTTDLRVEQASLDQPALQGRVLRAQDGIALPVEGAHVTAVGTDQVVTTGHSGEFSFVGLDFGPHTLLVQLIGSPDIRTEVVYRTDRQVHNVLLPQP